MNPLKARAAVKALKAADDAMDAYCPGTCACPTSCRGFEDPQYRTLYRAVEAAYDNPDLPDRHRDPDVPRGDN